jgi:hypothetical protein
MKIRRAEPLKPTMLAAYLEGEVTPSEGAAIETELAESPRARRRLARLREIGDALAAPIPEIEKVDLVVPWKQAAAARARSGWHGWRRIPEMLAIAAALVTVAFVAVRRPANDEFRAKSALGGNSSSQEHWSGVRIYRVDAAGEATRLQDRFRAAEGLLFSYTNLGPRPLDHFMVFAIDTGGAVRWFYPAYDREGTNPESIAIRKGDADVLLPDIVHQDFAPGPLAIHALFSDGALRVLDVEALLRQPQHRDPMEPLSIHGAVDHVVVTVVDP